MLTEKEWGHIQQTFRLSPRQMEICRLILDGLCDKQIADTLHLRFATVRTHISRLYAKTGVGDRCELITALFVRSRRLCSDCPHRR